MELPETTTHHKVFSFFTSVKLSQSSLAQSTPAQTSQIQSGSVRSSPVQCPARQNPSSPMQSSPIQSSQIYSSSVHSSPVKPVQIHASPVQSSQFIPLLNSVKDNMVFITKAKTSGSLWLLYSPPHTNLQNKITTQNQMLAICHIIK